MVPRWYNREFYEARAARPRALTALGWGQSVYLMAPVDATADEVRAAVDRMRERRTRGSDADR